jgi:NAD(P)-dependent dehydrogenase (short-subunit alcohol dehydrogenase family)
MQEANLVHPDSRRPDAINRIGVSPTKSTPSRDIEVVDPDAGEAGRQRGVRSHFSRYVPQRGRGEGQVTAQGSHNAGNEIPLFWRVSALFLEETFGLGGKVAVVTGGYGLIGSALSRGLAAAGAAVAVLGRHKEASDALAADIVAGGGKSVGTVADVLDSKALDAACDAVVKRFGRIDILVNCAGGGATPAARLQPDQPLFNAELREATRKVIDLNLMGTVLPTFAFGDVLAGGGGGVIVNIASAAARYVSPGVMGYSAAKAGVEQFTRWMAVETARRYEGRVRVNAIEPGYIVGGKNRPRYQNDDGSLTPLGEAVIAHIPAGRFGAPEDLVPPLLMLCSPRGGYVTGVVVPVNGGFALAPGV